MSSAAGNTKRHTRHKPWPLLRATMDVGQGHWQWLGLDLLLVYSRAILFPLAVQPNRTQLDSRFFSNFSLCWPAYGCDVKSCPEYQSLNGHGNIMRQCTPSSLFLTGLGLMAFANLVSKPPLRPPPPQTFNLILSPSCGVL